MTNDVARLTQASVCLDRDHPNRSAKRARKKQKALTVIKADVRRLRRHQDLVEPLEVTTLRIDRERGHRILGLKRQRATCRIQRPPRRRDLYIGRIRKPDGLKMAKLARLSIERIPIHTGT